MNIHEIVKEFAARHGCIAGVCGAEPLAQPQGLGVVPFVSRDVRRRTHPDATLPGVQSIVVVGAGESFFAGYKVNALDVDGGVHQVKKVDGMAQLSSLGQAADYHTALRALLKELADTLGRHGTFRYKILVDSPGLDERALAVRAGLGWYGRQGLVVSPVFGARFHVGCLLTTMAAEGYQAKEVDGGSSHQAQMHDSCPPHCRRCLDACPTGAIRADVRGLDTTRCLSYLTQKEDLSPEETVLVGRGRQLYGCDLCRNACPSNQAAAVAPVWVDPARWLAMSDTEFVAAYGHTAMAWRLRHGADVLRRNAQAVQQHGG